MRAIGSELVAVEYREVVVAGLDDEEQVHHVRALELGGRPVRQPGEMHDARIAHLLLAPGRRRHDRRVEPVDQRGDLLLRQLVGEAEHLGGRAAFGDGPDRLGLPQPRQALGQQGRARDAEPVRAVAGGAVFHEELLRLGRLNVETRR